MFSKEGNVKLVIGEVAFDECKFADGKGPNDFDICLHVTNADNQDEQDWVRLEFSECYGKGNFADRMQKDISIETLQKVGFDGDDVLQIESQLSGKTVPGRVVSKDHNGKTYYTVYLGGAGGNAPASVIDKAEIIRRLAGGVGGAGMASSGVGKSNGFVDPFDPFA